MNESGKIVLYGSADAKYAGMVERYAATYGRELRHLDRNTSIFQCAGDFKNAAFVWIWNGMQFQTPLAAAVCRRRGIPHAFYEYGLLPQAESHLVDTKGFCGYSMLNDPLQWLTREDYDRLHQVRAELREKHPIGDDGYILVPLQIENDTQILYHTDVRNMNELIDRVRYMYPRGEIVFRAHPRSGFRGERPFDQRCRQDTNVSFLDSCARASVVVGLTSTTLYEAAIMGKPVVALGDHPLRTHPERIDDVAAAVLALRVGRTDGCAARVLERFNIRPLGSQPCSDFQPSATPSDSIPSPTDAPPSPVAVPSLAASSACSTSLRAPAP